MEPLQLVKSRKEWLFLLLGLFSLFLLHLSYFYLQYKHITQEEIYQDIYTIKNIYQKDKYKVIKLKNDTLTYYTSINNDLNITQLQKVSIFFITNNLSFLEYLKGFYRPSFDITIINSSHYQNSMIQSINKQHSNIDISSIYKALFLAVPLPKHISEKNAQFGVAHLFAISGFHLGILLAFIYYLLNKIYKPIHKKYLPYRNKRYDILIISSILIFSYLIYIDFVPSFLRSFVMFILAIIFLRANIKLLSFDTLFLTFLIILVLFPHLLFSLSLWFSLFGVFYIFLFLHYFSNLNKILQFILFNIFIFASMNPIVHYFFSVTSYEQLLSPLFTVIFSLFYPLSLFAHFFGIGYVFDFILEYYLNYQTNSFYTSTPIYIFILFIFISLLSIWYKKSFYFFLVFITFFNSYLYIFSNY